MNQNCFFHLFNYDQQHKDYFQHQMINLLDSEADLILFLYHNKKET